MLRIALKLNVENRQKCVTQQEESNPWCHSIQKKNLQNNDKKKCLKVCHNQLSILLIVFHIRVDCSTKVGYILNEMVNIL